MADLRVISSALEVQGGITVNQVAVPTISSVSTLTNKTLTSPTINSPTLATPTITSPTVTGNASSGVVVCKRILFTQDAVSLTYTATVPLPANATLLDIIVSGGVVWNAAATTAVLKVGDTAVDDGYFTNVNLKATDLLAGETLAISGSNVAASGGKQGAYLVAATGQRGATASNFGAHNTAGTNILATVTVTGPSGTTGRTYVDIFYSVGEVITPVLA